MAEGAANLGDRELLVEPDLVEVLNKQPGRHYRLAHYDSKTITRLSLIGYQLVQGDMPEQLAAAGPAVVKDGSLRRLGDMVLMWMPQEKYEARVRLKERRNAARTGAVEAGFREFVNSQGQEGIVPVGERTVAFEEAREDARRARGK